MGPSGCIEVPLNPVITSAAGEYLMLVIACSVVARAAPDHAHALAAVLTGRIIYPTPGRIVRRSRAVEYSRTAPLASLNEFGVCHVASCDRGSAWSLA